MNCRNSYSSRSPASCLWIKIAQLVWIRSDNFWDHLFHGTDDDHYNDNDNDDDYDDYDDYDGGNNMILFEFLT